MTNQVAAPTGVQSAADAAWQRAGKFLALGQHHRPLLRPLFHGEDGAHPQFAARASGWRLIDLDGRTFVDWVSGTGRALLGHRHPAVEAAIREQLDAGPTLSLYHPIELDVAEALTQ